MIRAATLFTLLLLGFIVHAQQRTVGLLTRTPASEDGYVLFAPTSYKSTYLIDKCGRQVHSWSSPYTAGNSAYLLENGSLLRAGNVGNADFAIGSPGGVIEMYDWGGNLTWSYVISSDQECQHHDVCILPNGHVLALVWEKKTRAEAIAAGRDSLQLGSALWAEKVVELEPTGLNTANVVWEWDVWDHLVQDKYPDLPNYGSISDHPELVNINHPSSNPTNPDWLHMNALAYNADLDQIMISSLFFNEFWILDHSTSGSEGSTHTGGRQGKGGDLLYRWGNPAAYGLGTNSDQQLFRLHNAHWIAPGLKDAGKIMIFNNGQSRPDSNYSSVIIIDPPVDTAGGYHQAPGMPFGPSLPSWEYKSPVLYDFFSPILSGAQRLPGGNTLICEGSKGNFFEVDTTGAIVWRYVSPVAALTGPVRQGEVPGQNFVFRADQYPASYPAFNGRSLVAGAPVEQNPTAYNCFTDQPTQVARVNKSNGMFRAVNPFGRSISLTSEGTEREVRAELVNYMGSQIAAWSFRIRGGMPVELDLPQSITPGMYMLRIHDGGNHTVLKLQHY